MHRVILGSVIALSLVPSAFAKSPSHAVAEKSPAPVAVPAVPATSAIPAPLRAHLAPGASIYSGDKVIASLAQVDHTTGNIVIAELTTVGKLPPLKHVVAASALSWSNGKLVTDLNNEQIKMAPTY